MKTHYTLTRLMLTLAIVAGCIICRAQSAVEFLNSNNVNAGITTGGNLFSKYNTPGEHTQLMEFPAGSGIHPMYTASLWITGTDAGGNLKCAAQMYREHGRDFYDGPIMDSYTAAYDSFFSNVFKMTQVQVSLHRNKFAQLGTAMTMADVEQALLYWPAKGNQYVAANKNVNIASRLAPFHDTDGDGQYDPVKGDYPLFCGDQAIFFVLNDVRGPHTESGGQAIGAEVRGLAEVFVDTSFGGFNGVQPAKRVINNTVFVKYEIENKSSSQLFDARIGLYEDPDLGCYANDRVGCDVPRAMMFAYNSTNFDNDCQGILGYGNNRIAFGTKLLGSSLGAFNYFINGMPPAHDRPSTAQGFRNYTLGRWNDGSPFTTDTLGFGNGTPTQYIFSGDPQDPTEPSDVNTGMLLGGDRQMQGSSTAITLTPFQPVIVEYAFISSMDETATILSIVDTLKMQSDEIQAFYNNNILACRAQNGATGVAEISALEVSVYPNPASSLLMIESAQVIQNAEVTDMLGRTVLAHKADTNKLLLDVSALAKGVYLLTVSGGNKVAVKKIVVE